MRASPILLVLAAAPLAWSACGAAGDGGRECSIDLTVETATPVAGSSVVVSASSLDSGFLDLTWSVGFEASPVSCSDDADGLCEGTSIAFLPASPGPYQVSVSGTVDGAACNGDSATINVMAPGANNAVYRMVVTPLEAGAVHEQTIVVPGGADFDLGEVRLGTAIGISGTVSSAGAEIGAQLRFSSTQASRTVDVFSSPTLGFASELEAGEFDIDVLPADPSIAPFRLESIDATAVGDITLSPGDSVAGSVSDPSGAALAQARVSVIDAGLPSSIGESDGAGAFALELRASGGASTVAINPPATTGLPVLDGTVTALGDGSTLDVSYNNALVTTTRSFTVTEPDGTTPIAGARVTFLSDVIADAATVTVDGGSAATLEGRVRQTVVADGAGALASVALTDASYTIVVARPGQSPAAPARLRRVVGAGVDTNLSVAAAAQWTATLRDADGLPLANARVSFRPRGALALVAGASISAEANGQGVLVTDVVSDASYDVQVDAAEGYGRYHHGLITAPAAGELLDAGIIAVPTGQRLTGSVILSSGARARAHVALYCTSCPSEGVPTGEAVTDPTGRWQIQLPDSGTD